MTTIFPSRRFAKLVLGVDENQAAVRADFLPVCEERHRVAGGLVEVVGADTSHRKDLIA